MRLPRTQVKISNPMHAAITSGTQPPSTTRRMLAPKKIRSSARNGAITSDRGRAAASASVCRTTI